MDKSKSYLIYSRLALLVIIVVAIVYYVGGNIRMSWNIFLAVMGFSAVVFIHECGHFLAAKISKIKVHTFSVFLPPVLLGVRRTENGIRFRVLPKFFPKEDDPEGDGLLSFTVGKGGKSGETEYRVGLIPVAGYVRMLGQEDVGADKQVTDARSFGNKPTGVRMAVIAAGVIFNVIAAVVLMMGVYLIGINRLPPVVGGVVPNSPAARAGLKAGDEIVEIAGKSDDLDYGNILMAAALSNEGEPVPLKVRHENGAEEEYRLIAEQMAGMPVRVFGFYRPLSLTIAAVEEADTLLEKTGLVAGDHVKTVDGQPVRTYWELEKRIRNLLVPAATLEVERTTEADDAKLVEVRVPLDMVHAEGEIESESELNHICSIVPRLTITAVASPETPAGAGPAAVVRKGDVISAIGGLDDPDPIVNPTYKEMREVTEEHEGKQLSISVLRRDQDGTERTLSVTVVPKRSASDGRVLIGIGVALDAEHPVVAKTIAADGGPERLEIPRGATIIAVDGVEVSDFYDFIDEISRHTGKSVTIAWRLDTNTSGEVSLDLREDEGFITVRSAVAEFVPFEFMERLYKADGPLDALVMGSKKSVWFIVQTYVTLKQLFARSVSLEAMSGPVGIATMTYKAVEHSFVSFLYLLAFISANLAVINFLPIPVVDGGVFVLLLVEKIKRGPVSVRVQEAISYAGLALIAAVFLYLTYNDILRLILGS